jgi:1-acyl-sn-glycerol-3-phosphate acyltransferase
MQRFRKGAMKFSLELNIPVVPAVILGTEKAWPRKGRFIHSVPIDIHVLPPIYPKDFSEMNKTEYNKTIVKQTKILENLINDNYSLLRSDDSNNSSAK